VSLSRATYPISFFINFFIRGDSMSEVMVIL
jgi:hypothetical protein